MGHFWTDLTVWSYKHGRVNFDQRASHSIKWPTFELFKDKYFKNMDMPSWSGILGQSKWPCLQTGSQYWTKIMIESLNRLEKDVNSSTQTNLSLLISMIRKLFWTFTDKTTPLLYSLYSISYKIPGISISLPDRMNELSVHNQLPVKILSVKGHVVGPNGCLKDTTCLIFRHGAW